MKNKTLMAITVTVFSLNPLLYAIAEDPADCTFYEDQIVQAAVVYTGVREIIHHQLRDYPPGALDASYKYLFERVKFYAKHCPNDFAEHKDTWAIYGPHVLPELQEDEDEKQ